MKEIASSDFLFFLLKMHTLKLVFEVTMTQSFCSTISLWMDSRVEVQVSQNVNILQSLAICLGVVKGTCGNPKRVKGRLKAKDNFPNLTCHLLLFCYLKIYKFLASPPANSRRQCSYPQHSFTNNIKWVISWKHQLPLNLLFFKELVSHSQSWRKSKYRSFCYNEIVLFQRNLLLQKIIL